MSKTKGGSSTKLGRDSEAKRLGIKIYEGTKANVGNILVKQRGTKWYAGTNVRQGADDTLYAAKTGIVKFTEKYKTDFTGKKRKIKLVNII